MQVKSLDEQMKFGADLKGRYYLVTPNGGKIMVPDEIGQTVEKEAGLPMPFILEDAMHIMRHLRPLFKGEA